MSQLDKLLAKLLSEPAPRDFTWQELQKLLRGYGYTEKKNSGSRRKFYKQGSDGDAVPIILHEPHPESTIKHVYIKQIINALKDNGDLK